MSIQSQNLLNKILKLLKKLLKKQYHTQEQMEMETGQVLKEIEEIQDHSQLVLLSLIQNQELVEQIQSYLVQRICSKMSKKSFEDEYKDEIQKYVEPYPIQTQSLSKIIKDIFQGAKPLLQQIQKLKQNFETFSTEKHKTSNSLNQLPQKISLSCLLRMAMQRIEFNLQRKEDQMIFRLYILWESFGIILRKTEYVVEELNKCVVEQPVSQKVSTSNISKKSALSESVEIFKMNQKKKEKEEQMRLRNRNKKQRFIQTKNIIPSDYQLVCKPLKDVKSQKKSRFCCF